MHVGRGLAVHAPFLAHALNGGGVVDALLRLLLKLVQERRALVTDVAALLRAVGVNVVDKPERVHQAQRAALVDHGLTHAALGVVNGLARLVERQFVVALDDVLNAALVLHLEGHHVAQLAVLRQRLHKPLPLGQLHLAVDVAAKNLGGAPAQVAARALDLKHRVKPRDGLLDAGNLAVERLLGFRDVDVVFALVPHHLRVGGRPVDGPPPHGAGHARAKLLAAVVDELQGLLVQLVMLARKVAILDLLAGPLARSARLLVANVDRDGRLRQQLPLFRGHARSV